MGIRFTRVSVLRALSFFFLNGFYKLYVPNAFYASKYEVYQ